MSESGDRDRVERRVLVLTPTRKDASQTEALLTAAGIAVDIAPTFDAFIEELGRGAAAILIPEEVVASPLSRRLRDVIDRQEPWSDLPVLILTRPGANSAASGDAVRTLGNVTLLERPLQVTTLLSAVRTALRARERQHQIRGHLAERAQSEEILRIADQRKDEFLATLGHELRNPLAPLLSGLQVLQAGNSSDPHIRQITAIMERQIQHLVRLVDDLLEVSRITRGLIDLQRETLDLVEVVQAAIDTSRPLLSAAQHELVVELPNAPIAIEGDTVRLTQVFANLLTNAAKYTDMGGRIFISVTEENGVGIVSVRDNGIGIPADHIASIFDMFTQVDRSDRRSQGGLGIGLTLVRSLVAMHGGVVKARSMGPGAGSEFIVELPTWKMPATAAKPPTCTATLPPRRILVVDDNGDAADTLCAHLESLGATVSVANNGPRALEHLTSFCPDAVLLDIGMPDMNGYEVARRIRSTPNYGAVLLIALTGWGQDQDFQRSRAAGFDHHLVKPLDIHRLRQLLVDDRPMERVSGSRDQHDRRN